jgi:hypothetical protein
MRNARQGILLMFASAMALAPFGIRAAGDEHSGTWRLNLAKSKYSPGPAPKNLTETIDLDENTYKVEGNGTTADGQPMHLEFDAKFDGRDYPIRGIAWADVQSATWVDAHTPQLIQKKGGHVTMTVTCTVSTDGNARTCTMKGRDLQGRDVHNVVVFDKQ